MERGLSIVEEPLSIRAPAKVNWFLRILGKREDGYHDIESLMQCVSLYDDITMTRADSLVVECDRDIPVEDNLVFRAASLLKERAAYPGGVRIVLRKNIPIRAGLGGGSSDAAHTLTGLNELWGLGLGRGELCTLGARLGSDVPFFFHAPMALVEGRGERIVPVRCGARQTVLLVKPDVDISTKWAYEAYDALAESELTKKRVDIKLVCHALERQDLPSLSRFLVNDFEDLVLREYPIVREIKREIVGMGAEVSLMSGSGPTIFGLFRKRETAEKAAVEKLKPEWLSIAETLVEERAA